MFGPFLETELPGCLSISIRNLLEHGKDPTSLYCMRTTRGHKFPRHAATMVPGVSKSGWSDLDIVDDTHWLPSKEAFRRNHRVAYAIGRCDGESRCVRAESAKGSAALDGMIGGIIDNYSKGMIMETINNYDV